MSAKLKDQDSHTIHNWEARRSGLTITISGFDQFNNPVKVSGITLIDCVGDKIIAHDIDDDLYTLVQGAA